MICDEIRDYIDTNFNRLLRRNTDTIDIQINTLRYAANRPICNWCRKQINDDCMVVTTIALGNENLPQDIPLDESEFLYHPICFIIAYQIPHNFGKRKWKSRRKSLKNKR